MAQPQQYNGAPYGSPISTPSPMAPGQSPGFAAPPTKRPQMSPSATPAQYQQPLHSPITNGTFNPYAQTNPYPIPHQMSPSIQQPPIRQTPPPSHSMPLQPPSLPQQTQTQTQGTMGPPQKPEDNKTADLNEIGDVMHGVGIDLKAEEANLAMQARRTYPHAGNPGHFDPARNVLQANVPGDRSSFYGAGTFNQPAISQQRLEDVADAKGQVAIRKKAERNQFHNNEPFLSQSVVLNRINTCAQKTQTQVAMEGVYHPQANTTNRLLIVSPAGDERMATLTKEPLITTASPMSDLLALLSFAARERVRTAIEDSAAIAKGRRTTSHGIVPPDFQDIAFGAGKPKEATGEPVPVIGSSSPVANPLKRSHSQANDLPTPPSESDASPKPPTALPTIAFDDLIAQTLARRVEQEEKWEEQRLAKRARRATEKLLDTADPNSRSNSVSGTPAPGTPGGPVDGVAPGQGKMTKKEQKKKLELEAASSATKDMKAAVSQALGGKKLSWMTGGKAGSGGIGSGTSFGKRTPAGTPAKKVDKPGQVTAHAGTNAAGPPGKPRGLGGFREDREDGSGIQIRDLISVLKEHNPEKRTLSKAFSRLNVKR